MVINTFKEYAKRTEATYKAENEILNDKLGQGINGLEWLVLQIKITERKKESLNQFIEFASRIFKKDIHQLFEDAINMNPDNFYDIHEINWWITINEALTYLKILKERDYYEYVDLLNQFYRKGEKHEQITNL